MIHLPARDDLRSSGAWQSMREDCSTFSEQKLIGVLQGSPNRSVWDRGLPPLLAQSPTSPSGQKCYLSLRYVLLPMSPGRTNNRLAVRVGFGRSISSDSAQVIDSTIRSIRRFRWSAGFSVQNRVQSLLVHLNSECFPVDLSVATYLFAAADLQAAKNAREKTGSRRNASTQKR